MKIFIALKDETKANTIFEKPLRTYGMKLMNHHHLMMMIHAKVLNPHATDVGDPVIMQQLAT